MLLMGFAALFGLLNSNKVKTLRTELGVVTTIAFTVATVGFAYAQYLGVRRLA